MDGTVTWGQMAFVVGGICTAGMAVAGWCQMGIIKLAGKMSAIQEGVTVFKIEVARSYVPMETLRDMEQRIDQRFDRIEEKLDRAISSKRP